MGWSWVARQDTCGVSHQQIERDIVHTSTDRSIRAIY